MKKSQEGLKLFSQNATMQIKDEPRVKKVVCQSCTSDFNTIDASGCSIIYIS